MSFGCDLILPALLGGGRFTFQYCELNLSQYQTVSNVANLDYCELDLSQYRS